MMIRGRHIPREFHLAEILTEEQISLVQRLYKGSKKKFYMKCLTQIVVPNLNRIMDVLGPCDSRFVVYGIEYRCLKGIKRPKAKARHHRKELILKPRRRAARWQTEIHSDQIELR